MKIVVLGPANSPLTRLLEDAGHSVIERETSVDVEWLRRADVEFIVSYRYRHIIRRPVLDEFDGRAVNLHASYLPWNRGADPNLWSFLENTPKGVTIHHLDPGVDTGDIIVQASAVFDESIETLRTTYDRLNAMLVELFVEHMNSILSGAAKRRPQQGRGSVHRMADKASCMHLLVQGWDTPVSLIAGSALDSAKNG